MNYIKLQKGDFYAILKFEYYAVVIKIIDFNLLYFVITLY
jgi:hypothetical protein